MTEEPIDRELERAAGSPELAKAIRRSLDQLSSGAAGPEMAEMARDLIEGRIDLRSLAHSSVYADQLMQGVDGYVQWEAQLTPEQRQQFTDAQAAILGDQGDERQSRDTA